MVINSTNISTGYHMYINLESARLDLDAGSTTITVSLNTLKDAYRVADEDAFDHVKNCTGVFKASQSSLLSLSLTISLACCLYLSASQHLGPSVSQQLLYHQFRSLAVSFSVSFLVFTDFSSKERPVHRLPLSKERPVHRLQL